MDLKATLSADTCVEYAKETTGINSECIHRRKMPHMYEQMIKDCNTFTGRISQHIPYSIEEFVFNNFQKIHFPISTGYIAKLVEKKHSKL